MRAVQRTHGRWPRVRELLFFSMHPVPTSLSAQSSLSPAVAVLAGPLSRPIRRRDATRCAFQRREPSARGSNAGSARGSRRARPGLGPAGPFGPCSSVLPLWEAKAAKLVKTHRSLALSGPCKKRCSALELRMARRATSSAIRRTPGPTSRRGGPVSGAADGATCGARLSFCLPGLRGLRPGLQIL